MKAKVRIPQVLREVQLPIEVIDQHDSPPEFPRVELIMIT